MNSVSKWKPQKEKKSFLTRLGYEEGRSLFASSEPDTINRLAGFSLREYANKRKIDADPRRHPDRVISHVYKLFITKFALGFVNEGAGLFPSDQMLAFFDGLERAARVIQEDIQERKRKKKSVKRKKKK